MWRLAGIVFAGIVLMILANAAAPEAWREPIILMIAVAGVAGGVIYARHINWTEAEKRKQEPRFPFRQFPPPPPKPSTTYGSAEFHAPAPLASQNAPFAGIFLGKQAWPEIPATEKTGPLFTTPEAHTLIVAPTRTGKGRNVIQPTLLRYSGSMVVIDPKGENAAVSARIRQERGSQVYICNPWGLLPGKLHEKQFPPARLNPLDVIRAYDPNAVSIAENMADLICQRSGDAKARYFESNAAAILSAVMLWLADEPTEKLTFARVRDIVTRAPADLEKQFFYRMGGSSAWDGAIRQSITQFIGRSDDGYFSILSTLNEATRFMSDPQIKKATEKSDFDIATMAAGPVTLFLLIPPAQMQTQATWLRLVLGAVTSVYRYTSIRKNRCLMLIDEMPALGRVPDLPGNLATMGGYGLDYALIVQDLGQLDQHYKSEAQSIIANCAWKWMCNIRDHKTAKYVSDTLGNRTIATTSTSAAATPTTSLPFGMPKPPATSTTTGEAGRPLMTPDEVMQEGRDTAFVFGPTGRPWYVRTVTLARVVDEFGNLPAMQPYFAAGWKWDANPYLDASQDKPRGA